MHIIALIIGLVIVLLDQFIKYFSVYMLNIPFDMLSADTVKNVVCEDIELIPNLYSITFVANFNGALGMFENQKWVLVVFTIIAIAVLIGIVLSKKISSKLFYIASALIIGGGIGNLIDRIFLGYVIDTLNISFFPPVCNFADYCVTVGAILLGIYLIFFYKPNKKLKEATNE